jgi:hypothetical protein
VEDFTAVERLCDKEDENNLAVGISLDDELKWELYATTVGAGIPLIHQVYAICDKVVTISPAGLTCD